METEIGLPKMTIKPAAEYVKDEQSKTASDSRAFDEKVIQFINDVVRVKIEDIIACPNSYTDPKSGSAYFDVPSYPAEKFVDRLAHFLKPLGYTVENTHDGGGIKDMVGIRWKPKPSVPPLKPRHSAGNNYRH